MAAPTIQTTSPADNDVGIPIGETIEVIFDRGIDLTIAKNHVVLYGPDFDLTSGPDSAIWIDQDTGNNPFYLRSPGFKGLVDLVYQVVYIDVNGNEVSPLITSEADEIAGPYRHKLKLIPKTPLAPDTTYVLYLIGDPDAQDRGISSRTIFDVEPDIGNTSTTGSVVVDGSYEGGVADTVVVEITTGGDIGTAKYKWYYNSGGPASAVTGRVTSRRFRRLQDGIQIRFTGSGFVAGDIYRFNVEPIERMTTSTKVTFTTNDGSFTTAPQSPSTPATAEPPVMSAGSASTVHLEVLEMNPAHASYNNDPNLDTIEITFDATLDATTITDSTVKVWVLPVSGYYDDTFAPKELEKKLTVSGSKLTIEI